MGKEGWISIHRDISAHWIWQDPVKFKWWIDILLTVNHSPSKANIGMEIYDCDRGQSVMSLSSWAGRWRVTKDKVRNFFTLLEKDGMITRESLSKTTRITVCNYDKYQGGLHDSQTTAKRNPNDSQTPSHPNNKNNKNNNDNNKILSGETPVMKLHTRCKNYFHEKYEELFGETYYWEAKDGANLNPIIKKIRFNRENKNLPVDDNSLLSAFKVFIESITDDWILKNFSIPNINSKFNEIVSQAKIKNGKKKTESNIVDI